MVAYLSIEIYFEIFPLHFGKYIGIIVSMEKFVVSLLVCLVIFTLR